MSDQIDALARQALTGDEDAWADLFHRITPKLWRFFRSKCSAPSQVEDWVQETWTRFLKGRSHFDADRKFDRYIFKIAMHVWIDSGRKPPYSYYVLSVMAAAGSASEGEYGVTLQFQAAYPPFESIDLWRDNSPTSPNVTLVTDFDGDGIADIASANGDTSDVTILWGVGDGTFASTGETVVPVGAGPESLTSSDFNGDGLLDLAVGNRDSNDVSIFLGEPGRAFINAHPLGQTFPLAESPRAIVAGDFVRDPHQRPDLAIATHAGPVLILVNDASGQFIDLAQSESHLGSMPGPAKSWMINLRGSTNLRDIVSADLDSDGDLDLAVATRGSGANAVQIFWNEDGFFGDYEMTDHHVIGPRSLITGYFDDDEFIDLATVSDDVGESVSLLFGGPYSEIKNRPLERLRLNGDVSFDAGQDSEWIASGDLNGDGTDDLIVSDESEDGSLSILLGHVDEFGRSDGTFELGGRVSVGAGPQRATSGQLNDDNGDGLIDQRDILDLVVPNRDSSELSVLLGRGDGTFFVPTVNVVGDDPEAIATADVNRDGRDDVVVANRVSDDVSVLLGRGHGQFEPERRFDVGPGPLDVKIADVDGDGFLDVVTADGFSNSVSILWGRGNGFFDTAETFEVGDRPSAVQIGDFNVDGVLDLATYHFQGAFTTVRLGQTGRLFTDGLTFETGSEPYDLGGDFVFAPQDESVGRFTSGLALAADLNGDQHLDLVALNDFAQEIIVRLGRGDGTFASEIRERTLFPDPDNAAVGDVNHDGFPDLIVTHRDEDALSVLFGKGDGR
ncbi:MAG: VCBS repeat-containing protein, partial [Planctomycetales bacterium]|nr:VCBS repeat-containing protein [Planctomycetales bacterium]